MFVRKYSGCDWTHKRHPHTERNLFRGGKRDVSAAHLETAAKLLENNMPTAMVDEWLSLVSGNKLSKDSIKSLRQSVMYTKHNSDGTRDTTAQKLIHNLQTTENCEYIILTGGYDEALDRVRITKPRKSKRSKEVMEDVTAIDEEMEDQVKNVVKGLALGRGQFLLAVAWVTKESKLNHIKFPWVLGGDETFRTNAEKRPLARLVGMNTNNNVLPFVNSFIPSKQKWVFYWLWSEAYPTLLDSDALKKTKLILVDQDENNWLSMMAVLGPKGKKHGLAIARLCNWHKIDRNLVTKIISYLLSVSDNEFRDVIVHWLYAFTSSVESEDEEKHYLSTMATHIVQVESSPGPVNPELVEVNKPDNAGLWCHRSLLICAHCVLFLLIRSKCFV